MISSLKNIHLDLSIAAPLFIAIAFAVALFTLFIYRRTNPIIPTLQKSLLIFLRTTALLLLLLVLFQTTLQLFFEKKNAPLLAVAIDTSASMTITDNNGSRAGIVDSILQNDLFSDLKNKFDIKYYTFSNMIKTLQFSANDTMQFIGDATDIQKTLEAIKVDNAMENLNGVLIVSDGVYNAGGNPVRTAEALGIPVHTIAVGSTEPLTDLAITDVEANPYCYVDQSTPIRFSVHNSGFSSLTLPATLQENAVTVATESMSIQKSPSDKEFTINYTPTKIGRQKLVISIPTQNGEQTSENNQRTFYLDVFKSKLKISIIAGSLSPDISFLKRLLTTDRYQPTTHIQKKSGEFYNGKLTSELENADMYIFYDFPTSSSSPQYIETIKEILNQKKQPILFIPGSKISTAQLPQFTDFIPIASIIRLPQEQLAYVQLSPLGETHPVMQVAPDATIARSLWGELPPVFTSFKVQQLATDAKVLAYSRSNVKSRQLSPLVVLRTNGAHKSAAIIANELWRWDLMMWGINRSEDVYRNMLINLARWLETNRSESLVRVDMDDTNYKYGEGINMRISVFDENLNPVENATVGINLKKGEWRREYSAQSVGKGKYTVTIQPPNPGDYKATVGASHGELHLGEQEVLFSVGEYSAELADLQAQPAVLQGLSRATGGSFATPDSMLHLVSSIQGAPTITAVTRENELWNNKIIMAVILLLLTSEWFIRKRKGMV